MTEPLTTYLPQGARFSNPVAAGTHWVGDLLMMPALETADLALKLIEPLQPGYHRQWSNTALEVTRRVLIVFALLLLLPLDLALTPFGIGLSALANLARRDFVFIDPGPREDAGEPQNQLPSILTFNTALMFDFISTHNGIRSISERVDIAAETLARCNVDIICLQECFDEESSLKIARRLGDAYPYKIMDVAHRTLGVNSGLAMFSKYRPRNVTFWQYEARGGIEVYANKGLLAATMCLPRNKIMYVFTTHLCGPVPASEDKKEAQMREAREYIQTYVREHPPAPGEEVEATYFAGDFNLEHPESYLRNTTKNHPGEYGAGDYSGYYLTQNTKNDFDYFSGNGFYGRYSPYHPDGALADENSGGTFFSARDPLTRWDTARIREWRNSYYQPDHILYITRRPVQQRYLRHHMNGSSDHLAVLLQLELVDNS